MFSLHTMPQVIKSICLKCGKEGIQSIVAPDKKYPSHRYLRFQHGKNKFCWIGRVRSTAEAMGEFNSPQSKEEYEDAFKSVMKHLRQLEKHYAPMMRKGSGGSFNALVTRLQALLREYGY